MLISLFSLFIFWFCYSTVEVVSVRPAVPHTNTTCALNPCQNGGTCLMDETLGYRCLCPLGTGGSICKDSKQFSQIFLTNS